MEKTPVAARASLPLNWKKGWSALFIVSGSGTLLSEKADPGA
jgi:hypothetical protein